MFLKKANAWVPFHLPSHIIICGPLQKTTHSTSDGSVLNLWLGPGYGTVALVCKVTVYRSRSRRSDSYYLRPRFLYRYEVFRGFIWILHILAIHAVWFHFATILAPKQVEQPTKTLILQPKLTGI